MASRRFSTFPARALTAGTTVLAPPTAGCGAERATGQPSERAGGDQVAGDLQLGDATLAPEVRGVTLLVVGDSWARNLGVGVADADRDRRNVIVNAGVGGCGLLQPVQIRAKGKLVN